jgi:uncharacterized Ntn-hydrolase superfamily protein
LVASLRYHVAGQTGHGYNDQEEFRMTYSIIARCSRTGQLGIGVASFSMAIGRYCDGAVRSGIGVTQTQGAPNPRNNYLAINLLAQGHTASQALATLIANDPKSDYRQIALVDRHDSAVIHAGGKLRPWAGHRIGAGYVAFGDGLAGPQVIDAMIARFDATAADDLDERFLAALEAGRDAGGLAGAKGRLPERSAAVVVWGNRTHNELDLRTDLHDDAIAEVRRIHADYKPTIAYYDERARHPRGALTGVEFAAKLKQRKEVA